MRRAYARMIVCFFSMTLIGADLSAENIAAGYPPGPAFTSSLAGGILLPIGDFSTVVDLGGDVELAAGFENLLFPRSVLTLRIGNTWIDAVDNDIEKFNIVSLALLLGYSIDLGDFLSITPLFGGGYIGSFITGAGAGVFFDPQLRIGTDIRIGPRQGFSLHVSAAAALFFEQTRLGAYAGFSLGFAGTTSAAPKPTVLIGRSLNSFSPNGDGVMDMISVTPKVTGGFERYEMRILEKDGSPVRIFRGGNDLPAEWVWDGTKDDGGKAPDGAYRADLALVKNGLMSKEQSTPFDLDTTSIEATLAVSDGTVYTAGVSNANGSGRACFWTGTDRTDLIKEDWTEARSIAVFEGNVYTCGKDYYDSRYIPCYWTGTFRTTLPIPEYFMLQVNSIAVEK